MNLTKLTISAILQRQIRRVLTFRKEYNCPESDLEWIFEDGTKLLLSCMIHDCLPPEGCYGASLGFILSRGPLSRETAVLRKKLPWPDSKIIMENSGTLVQRLDFPAGAGQKCNCSEINDRHILRLVNQVGDHFEQNYFPYLRAFIEDYPRALDFILHESKLFQYLHIRTPFLLTLTLMKLCGDYSGFNTLVFNAEKEESFYDYKWFSENKSIQNWFAG